MANSSDNCSYIKHRKFQVPAKDFEMFYTCPSPSYLVDPAAQDCLKQLSFKMTPKDKETKWLDLLDRKNCFSATTQMKLCNDQALLYRYVRSAGEKVGVFWIKYFRKCKILLMKDF